jgi:hypothetical protein
MRKFLTSSRLSNGLSRLLAAPLLLIMGSAVAYEPAPLPERVQVVWAAPKQLSEVQNNPMRYGILRPEGWMKSLGDYLRVRADRVLPPGQQLQVTIDDITLAGSFEPWHGPALDDARFVEDIYPPRLRLHYKLLASDGSTLRESGEIRLIDLGFLQHTGLPTETDPLRYDKRQIDDWLKHEFRQR